MKGGWRIRCTVICLFLFGAGTALAQSSPNIPIDDPVYRDIDRLVSFGLAPDVIYGQRPWSRTEIARLVSGAAMKFKDLESPMTPSDNDLSWRIGASELLKRLQERFHEELDEEKVFFIHPLSYVQGEYSYVDADARAIPVNGIGGAIDGMISPLTAYREGRHYPDGHQMAVETEHSARLTRFFSLYVRPRFQAEIHDNQDVSFNPFIQQLYGKFTVPHFELEAGRDSLEWGQGEFGGILLSNNARPLDMIKASNPSPSFLPWYFRYMGPIRYTVFVANMGPEREFPRSFLTGFKVSIKPAHFLEMGLSHIMNIGGEGAPTVSFFDGVQEFFMHRAGNTQVQNLANHLFGLDFRCLMPFLRNSQVYLDVAFEDARKWTYMLHHLANYQAGYYLPRLSQDGAISLRLEYKHGSPYYAQSGTFTSGLTLNGNLLGDALGRDGDGFYAKIFWDRSGRLQWRSEFHVELREADAIAESADHLSLIKVTDLPTESRIGLSAGAKYRVRPDTEIDIEIGYDRVHQFNFTAGDQRNSIASRVGIRFNLF